MLHQFEKRFIFSCFFAVFNFACIAQNAIKELPLTVYISPASHRTAIIYISGDGGINEFSRELCTAFKNKGYPVVALDSKSYFWKARNPDSFTADINNIATYYLPKFTCDSFIVVGYSFGADVAAFLPSRLAGNTVRTCKAIFLMAPSTSTDFEIKVSDMLGFGSSKRKYSISDELFKTGGKKLVCLFPAKDNDLKNINHPGVRKFNLPGDHRFDYNYSLIVNTVLSQL